MGAFANGLRLALRRLAQQPGLTALGLLVVTLGIGLATAVFSVLNVLVLRPLPYRDPTRVVIVQEWHRTHGYGGSSYGNYLDWSRDVTAFSSTALLAVSDPVQLAQLDGQDLAEGPQEVALGRVTASFFPMLGVSPALGRWLSPEEEVAGRDEAIVLTDPVWQRWFGRRPDVVGRTVFLDGRRRVVVGVMPRGFHFNYGSVVTAFAPFTPEATARDARRHATFARLAQGAALGEARGQLATVASRLGREYPATNGNWTLRIAPLSRAADMADPSTVRTAQLALVAALLVLGVCGANLACLLLARALGRSRELAIRVALGASRLQAVRTVVAESLLLSLLGAVAAVPFSYMMRGAVTRLVPAYLDFPSLVLIDVRSVAFALALGLMLGTACAALPALLVTAVAPSEVLKDEAPSAGGSRSRLLDVLVAGEVAGAAALLVLCGLLVRSLVHLETMPLGYRTKDLLTMRLVLPATRGPAAVPAFYDTLTSRVERLPGVIAVAVGECPPLSGEYNGLGVLRDGREPPVDPRLVRALVHAVTPSYFAALGIVLQRGRLLDPYDTAQSQAVAVVSESLARREWADADPVGRSIRVDGGRRTVVGIVSDVRHRGPLSDRVDDDVYLALAQAPARRVFLAVHGRGVARLAPALRRTIRDLDSTVVVSQARTMEGARAESTEEAAARTGWAVGLSLLGLVLAVTGLSAAMASWVGRRARELAVRQALGADRRRIVGLVLSRTLWVAGPGAAAGLAAAAAGSRMVTSVLYGVDSLDGSTYLMAAVATLSAALLTGSLPAIRASRVEPADALRRC
ncbi:MAG TPA: ADOP family duplicated permease [Vicinamibacteria bacterium]|nr:ADOP family duplicated permease [Vicinamibacteria bacterium]